MVKKYTTSYGERVPGYTFKHPSKTQQHFANEVNIHEILRRCGRTGGVPPPNTPPQFGDFSSMLDFREAQQVLAEGNQAFAQLPALIRKRFDNDPGQLLDFLANPENHDEAARLGIINPRKQETQNVAQTDNNDSTSNLKPSGDIAP